MKRFFMHLFFLYFVFLKSEARPLPPPATGEGRKNYSNQPGELSMIPFPGNGSLWIEKLLNIYFDR